MPSTIAVGVLIIAIGGRCSASRMPLITPFFSSSVCHARVRSRKFIHIGRMKMKTTKFARPIFLPRRMSASGKASRKQISVLTKESSSESFRAFR